MRSKQRGFLDKVLIKKSVRCQIVKLNVQRIEVKIQLWSFPRSIFFIFIDVFLKMSSESFIPVIACNSMFPRPSNQRKLLTQ